jgi:hypothetical protein
MRAGRRLKTDRTQSPAAIATPKSGLLVAPFRFPASHRRIAIGLGRSLEFRGALLDGFLRCLDIAQPDGLRGDLVDASPDRSTRKRAGRPAKTANESSNSFSPRHGFLEAHPLI